MEFLSEKGMAPRFIASHPDWTARGYVFITENDGKMYLLANMNDISVAIARVISEGKEEDLEKFTHGIPISEHEVDFQTAANGMYVMALALE